MFCFIHLLAGIRKAGLSKYSLRSSPSTPLLLQEPLKQSTRLLNQELRKLRRLRFGTYGNDL